MTKKFIDRPIVLLLILLASVMLRPVLAQELIEDPDLDARVRQFLDTHRRQWRDMNIPQSDGQLLFDLITENGYQRALEIGTSTGHSGIWIAWALSKTGGKLITIEIDASRHREALGHFEDAGLSEYIDARLADAHTLVKELEGPFDFVFSDADKGWYTNYFKDVSPKLEVGGCFTAHNISGRRGGRYRGGGGGGTAAFLEYVESLSNYETTVNSDGGGVSISFKRSER